MDIFRFIGLVLYFIDNFLVPLIFAIAFIVFLWGMYTYFILGGANEEKRKEGQKLAVSGIIGFVIMIAVWGIVILLLNSLGFNSLSRPRLPTFGSPNQQQQGTQNIIFQQGTTGTTGSNTGSGTTTKKPLGAVCSSHLDAECQSGECDWNGQVSGGQQVFTCQTPTTNTSGSGTGSTGTSGTGTTGTTGTTNTIGAHCSPSVPCVGSTCVSGTCVLGVTD